MNTERKAKGDVVGQTTAYAEIDRAAEEARAPKGRESEPLSVKMGEFEHQTR